jgi:hypothetical protein
MAEVVRFTDVRRVTSAFVDGVSSTLSVKFGEVSVPLMWLWYEAFKNRVSVFFNRAIVAKFRLSCFPLLFCRWIGMEYFSADWLKG